MNYRLYYFSPFDVQRGVAHSIQIMRMCSAFVSAGYDVVLLTPFYLRTGDVKNISMDELWDYYGVPERFKIIRIPTILWENAPAWLESINRIVWTSIFLIWHAVVGRTDQPDIMYSRCFGCSFVLGSLRFLMKKETILAFELHGFRAGRYLNVLLKQDAIVVVSAALKADIVEWGIDPDCVLVGHDGVETAILEGRRLSTLEARNDLGLPVDLNIACYTGKIGWTDDPLRMIEVARHLRGSTLLLMVGGRPESQRHFERIAKERGVDNIRFVGHVEPGKVHKYHLAADVLVQIHAAAAPIHRHFSPLKLFEYMAARKPIVAEQYPVLQEVLTHNIDAYLVPPRSPETLALAIMKILDDPTLGELLATNAYEKVKNFTWQKRARDIGAFLLEIRRLRLSSQ